MAQLPPWVLFPAALLAGPVIAGEQGLLAPQAFLRQALGEVPEARVLWLTPPMRARLAALLGHEPAQLRQRYWSAGAKTAWILEEIGKEQPITTGIVIDGGKVAQMRVLI